jgi:hypothetical protein
VAAEDLQQLEQAFGASHGFLLALRGDRICQQLGSMTERRQDLRKAWPAALPTAG